MADLSLHTKPTSCSKSKGTVWVNDQSFAEGS